MKINEIAKKSMQSSAFPTFTVLILMIIINVILQPGFFSPDILKPNITTFTPLILVSMAQGIVILAGGIDLSIGAAVTLVNVIIASMMKDTGGSIAAALLCGAGAALFVGLVNGIAVGYLRLPAIIATFATSAVWYGLSLLIMPQPGGYIPPFFYGLLQENILYIIPVPLLIIVFSSALWQFFRQRRVHRYIYAVGGDEEAASASGINTGAVKVLAFILSGVFVALAGIFVTAQTASGDAHVGQSFALTSVAAAVIGGISLQGGKGSLTGAAMGACILGLLINIIFFASIPSMYQEFIKGFIIIVALGLAVLPRIRQLKYNV